MAEVFDHSEEARRGLLHEVAALRKQSVFALILAVLFVLVAVYLYYQLEKSKEQLAERNRLVEQQNTQLGKQRDSINALNNELNKWRESLIREDPAPVSTPKPGPTAYTLNPKMLKLNKKAQAASVNSFFGYIVYIQDRSGSQISEMLQQELKEKGAIVPPIEHIAPTRSFRNAVKYFHEQDKDIATQLHREIMQILKRKGIDYKAEELSIVPAKNKRVPVGQLEVWIDR